jgi:hypothetical protein
VRAARLRGDERTMTEVEAAWVAGLYEGEGSLVSKPTTTDISWELVIVMTDQDVIEKLARITGVGNVTFVKRAKAHWSDQYRWRVSRMAHIAHVLSQIEEHLGSRRRARSEEFFTWHASRITPSG